MNRKPNHKWCVTSYPGVACWFRWKWRAKLHYLGHLQPGRIISADEWDRLHSEVVEIPEQFKNAPPRPVYPDDFE